MKQEAVARAVGQPAVASRPRIQLPYLSFLYVNKNAKWAMVILLPILLITFLAPFLPLQAPLESNIRASLNAPSLEHPFGTDKLGRDVFSRTLSGIKVSLFVGMTVALISLAFGIALGTASGFFGKTVDRVIMGVVDIFLAFPSLLLAIGLVAILGAGTVPVICAISLADVPRFIRLQRSLVLSLKSRPFIDAARTVQAPRLWLMTKHIVPNTIAPLLVAASITAANAILIEASLSFLGLGILPPEPSLGNIIKDGQVYLQQAWWISTLPGAVILLIAISLHFLSDGIREALDPRARK
ncbi:ABC transporter permease [Paenibacillus harenae]|uniref:ABC transporter permease n=1 Tax=Paenibacillus harenae TaxID=306543 RepID=UPI000418D871|nr:ABC transporter permease [Paenibacillus harenae]